MASNGTANENGSSGTNDTATIHADLGESLLKPRTISSLRTLADAAQDVFAQAGKNPSLADIDRKLHAESDAALTADEKYAVHEMNIMLAKYGKTPVNSVEGLAKLRKMLVRIYQDNTLVPAATRNELAVLNRELHVIETTYDAYLEYKKQETEAKRSAAEVEALGNAVQIKDAQVQLEVKDIERSAVIDSTHTNVLESIVANKTRTGELRNDEKVLSRVLHNDQLEKLIEARKRTAKIVWGKAISPALLPLLKFALAVMLIGMVFAFFVEQSGTPMYPLLEPLNNLRHFIVDPIAITVEGWIEYLSTNY